MADSWLAGEGDLSDRVGETARASQPRLTIGEPLPKPGIRCAASMLLGYVMVFLSSSPVLAAPEYSEQYDVAARGVSRPIYYFHRHIIRYSGAFSLCSPAYVVFIPIGGCVMTLCCIIVVVWVGSCCALSPQTGLFPRLGQS